MATATFDRNESVQSKSITKQRSVSGGMRRPSISISFGRRSPKNSNSTKTAAAAETSVSMASLNRSGGVSLCKSGTGMYQDLILNALMLCYNEQNMDTNNIASKLDGLGLKCMVISGDANFSFYNARDALSWSKWNCTIYGIFTIIIMQYREPLALEETVKCLQPGSMHDDDREMVKDVLSECRRLGTMKVKDIAQAIKVKGFACLVLRETNEYHYYKKHEMRMSWSEWECADYGKFSIILLKFALNPPEPEPEAMNNDENKNIMKNSSVQIGEETNKKPAVKSKKKVNTVSLKKKGANKAKKGTKQTPKKKTDGKAVKSAKKASNDASKSKTVKKSKNGVKSSKKKGVNSQKKDTEKKSNATQGKRSK